jgi:hypothetical protein
MVRVANLAPTSDLVDVCIRPSGSSDWGRPILLDGGLSCADAGELGAVGFGYTQVSVTFTAPAATVDVKMIPGGSTCSAAALGEGDGLTLATNSANTLALIGGNNVAETVIGLPESDSAATSGQRFRFVHAAPGTSPLDVGIAASSALPTTLTVPILSGPVPFGGPIPSGVTATFMSAMLQDNGYLQLFTSAFDIGAAVDGDTTKKAILEYTYPDGTATYSMYVVGIAGNNQYPLRALICSEDVDANGNPLHAGTTPFTINCVPSPLSTISVDVFNPALYGPNSPDFSARRGLVPPAIKARDADVMCIVEVDEQGDKDNIIDTATSTMDSMGGTGTGPYGYVFLPTTNLTTPITNPADQNGHVPPAPTAPPCSGVDSSDVQAAVSCGQTNCSSTPTDPNGTLLNSTNCLVENCAAPFLNVQTDSVACYDCLVVYIASDTSWQQTQSNCTTDSAPPLGFAGAQNSMIISKYPLMNTDFIVLPSTFYRRTILYAQVQLEDQVVDFYCGFLSTTLNASALPYVGNYGGSATDSQDQYDNEQLYQAQQTIAYVQQKSGSTRPAIMVGDWRSSIGLMGTPLPGTNLPNDLNPQTMMALQMPSNYTTAIDTSTGTTWAPQCNFCPQSENPYNLTDSYFVEQPFLINWPANATTSESLLYTQGAVDLDAGVEGPISPYYGLNVRVIRPH